jgi:LuxR family maltose regulon positive regulatory protein
MEAIELAGRHGWSEEPITGVACVQLAGANLIQGQLDEAERWLERAERTIRAELEPGAGMTLHWIRGGLERARGRPERALDEHRTAERLAELMRSPFVSTVALRADALQILVRLGQTDSVEAALDQMDDQERDTAAMRGVIAALRLAGDDPQAAAVALAPVIAGSVPSAAPLWLVEALLLEAIAREALGDQVAAERALERALDVAEPDHVRLHFLLHPVRKLLERHARHRTAHAALIAEILSLLAGGQEEPGGNGETGGPPVRGTGLIEPLSQAEIRVLRYLPTHLPVPEIAGQLHLSVNTVRTHMRHVYDKLGAHSRHQAVERSRALGLLAPSPRGT